MQDHRHAEHAGQCRRERWCQEPRVDRRMVGAKLDRHEGERERDGRDRGDRPEATIERAADRQQSRVQGERQEGQARPVDGTWRCADR